MKIYFAGSMRGGRDDQKIYAEIIQFLQDYGEVLTEHVGENISQQGEKILSDKDIFRTDVAWLKEATVVVAEVTNPSLGVGYEIGRAESLDKPILCLFRKPSERELSAMIGGNKNLHVKTYNVVQDIPGILKNFFPE